MNFEEYKFKYNNKIHRDTVIFCWSGTMLCFMVELAIFFVFAKNEYLGDDLVNYFLLRIVRPTSINVFASLICTICVYNKSIPQKVNNFICCLAVLTCCSCIAIFHIYYQFLIFSISFAIFITVLYGDEKLLKQISYISAIPSTFAGYAFYIEHTELVVPTRITCLIVYITMMAVIYFLSKILVQAQQRQTEYIYNNYKRQNALIQELKIEPMTHLYNKLCMEACLNSFYAKYQNDHVTQALAIIDIDKFKDVNDTFGHEAGDEVLITLAKSISDGIGGIRHAFRFGGEEFVITFTNMDRDSIQNQIQGIKDTFSNHVFEFAPDKHFTFTAGVAFLIPQMEDKNQWFNAADEAMYEGKESGRNKIVFYGD